MKNIIKIVTLATLITTSSTICSIKPSYADEITRISCYDTETHLETTETLPDTIMFDNKHEIKKPNSDLNCCSIIGSNDITKVTNTRQEPYNGVCYLLAEMPNGTTQYGTAWLTDRDIAVTAGHCIYDRKTKKYAKKVTIYPARQGYNAYYGSIESKKMYINSDWKTYDSDQDYGVIKLKSKVNSKCTDFMWSTKDSNLDGDYELMLVGYSGSSSGANVAMHEATGYAEDYDDEIISHNIDSENGDSGAPILIKKKNNYYVVGMNIGHKTDCSINYAVRITKDLKNTIHKAYD